ncbi:MAG: 1-deoxy-D-xylulose-5-phosphate synthase [Desulfovibrionaceae bacterium]|nr:1-deoxy-D-xylulose-5-phosphate synthase [Desulfovibrionaceae bacterium]
MPCELPPLLSSLNLPGDIPALTPQQREELAREARDVIIRVVSRNGGHLASSLGVVELTIALLTVFDPRRDAVIWDVGHQSYPWKLFTGRAPRFGSLRRQGGLSGFPRREESPCDTFGAGHASTSLSAALGMAVARDLMGGDEHVVAVIGDGALTGGMAFEALNQAGSMGKRLIVILNDNNMSIAASVGALSQVLHENSPGACPRPQRPGPPAALSLFLSHSLLSRRTRRIKQRITRVLRSVPSIGPRLLDIAERGEISFKSFFTPGSLFGAFHFNYIGPIDGHDSAQLIRYLEAAKELDAPVLLHVRTQKGRGYAPAEADPERFHGVSGFSADTGRPLYPPSDEPHGPGYSRAFGKTLCRLAESDPRIVAITAAMPDGTGLSEFRERFPDRFVDVGICEEHAVTFAAGLAARGLRPVVAIYSTFMQRAYDQIIHDVCLQKLPVVLCLDRAGLVGEDGPTHHGAFDLSWLRVVPDLALAAPRDEADLAHALFTALKLDGPTALRYPRGHSRPVASLSTENDMDVPPRSFRFLPPGSGEMLMEGEGRVCVVAAGQRALPALEAARRVADTLGHRAAVFDPRWIKPLPEAQLLTLAKTHEALLLVEENSLLGGFSSAVLELLADHHLPGSLSIRRLGLPDRFVPHGEARVLRAGLGLNVDGIASALEKLVRELP